MKLYLGYTKKKIMCVMDSEVTLSGFEAFENLFSDNQKYYLGWKR